MKLYRTVLFAPGDNQKKCEKDFTLEADAVVLDLEDAVAPERKVPARQVIQNILSTPRKTTVFVRVNPVSSPFILDDLTFVVGLPIEGIMLPKTESGENKYSPSWKQFYTVLQSSKYSVNL